MGNPSRTPQQTASDHIESATAAGNAVYDTVNKTLNDARAAEQAFSATLTHAISESVAVKGVVDAFMLLIGPLLSIFFTGLTELRQGVTRDNGDVIASVLNEFLMTNLDASDLAPNPGGDEILARVQKMGAAVLNRLESEFGGTTTDTPGRGQKAAETFAGFGVNFGIQNGIITLLAGILPQVHMDDIRELGVEIASNLGLGRLMRVALRPLVQTLIATPYQRELNARYQTAILSNAELVKAYFAERIMPERVQQLMKEQGLSDDQNAELIEQARERLTSAEIELLNALGKKPADDEAHDDYARGMDSDWLMARQFVKTWQRQASLRDRVLSAQVSRIERGFDQIPMLDALMQRLGVPEDEQALWRMAASTNLEASRKRPSESHMLYLYEAAQITDLEVEAWLLAEGYYGEDVQRMLTYFRLKLVSATQNKTSASAIHAANVHLEHIAYVTDEITGLWGRPPSPAELTYWVTKLDAGQRTKHDFVTELKALPAEGPAMPQP